MKIDVGTRRSLEQFACISKVGDWRKPSCRVPCRWRGGAAPPLSTAGRVCSAPPAAGYSAPRPAGGRGDLPRYGMQTTFCQTMTSWQFQSRLYSYDVHRVLDSMQPCHVPTFWSHSPTFSHFRGPPFTPRLKYSDRFFDIYPVEWPPSSHILYVHLLFSRCSSLTLLTYRWQISKSIHVLFLIFALPLAVSEILKC